MNGYDRIFGSSKLATMLRHEKTIEAGMAELGLALDAEIKRQDRAAKRKASRKPAPPRKRRKAA